MPSDKPKIVIYTDQLIIKKLDIMADKHNRSRGNMCETIIKNYIEAYEHEHGEIKVEE